MTSEFVMKWAHCFNLCKTNNKHHKDQNSNDKEMLEVYNMTIANVIKMSLTYQVSKQPTALCTVPKEMM